MNNHLTTIKVSACEHLIFLKKKYLSIGLHCLTAECARKELDEDLVFALCRFIVSAKSIVTFIGRLLQKQEGGTIKVTANEASVIKAHLRIFKISKGELSRFFNLSVEIH